MKNISLCFVLLTFFITISCTKNQNEPNLLNEDFKAVAELARGSTVKFFMWGGSITINNWIDQFVAAQLKEKYQIKLVRIPADASIFINKLLGEKKANIKKGSIDLIWINGENFKNARENHLLFGPYLDKLPHYNQFVDPKSVEYDFGYPVAGYEVPYGKAQFVFEYDSNLIKNPPQTFQQLLAWVKNNPGKFTYPQPPDFTGSAFIRQVFYEMSGGYEQYMGAFKQQLYQRQAPLLWSYLNEIKPYLWQNGKTYPKDYAALENLFIRGEILINMSYNQSNAQNKILQNKYKKSIRTFVIKNGSLYNNHYTAIPFNAPNKAGAMVTANFLLSPEAQLSKNRPENWGDLTVLAIDQLPPADAEKFRNLDLGEATLPLEILNQNSVPEISAQYVEKLEDEWNENVLN